MKVSPIATPQPTTGQIVNNGQPTPRDRAIAMLNQAQSAPVQDPTNVSPEEMAVVTKTAPKDVQNDTSVEASNEPENSSTQEASPDDKPKGTEPSLSSQYAQLARKEKALRAQARDLRLKEEALRAKEAEVTAPKQPAFDESKYIPKDRFQQDLLGTLSELGISYDQLTEQVLSQSQSQDPATKAAFQRLQAEIQSLKDAQEKAFKAQQDQQQQNYSQALNEIRNEASRLVRNDPTFETIRETGSVNDVVELIEQTFKEDGILLTVEEAAQEVEDYLVDQLSLYATKINKIKQKLSPKQQSAPQQSGQPNPQAKPSHPTQKTLTNSMASSRQLSARERAILAFKGETKK